MLDHLSPPDRAKLYSAYHAMGQIEDGMRVGLGTGTTAAWLVKLLGAKRYLSGLNIKGVATSSRTEQLAQLVDVPMVSLDQAGWLDLTIDGADEFDPLLTLIKGGGGALLQEKIVATASDRMIVVTDESKEVATLGAYPLPVEITQFGCETTRNIIEDSLENLDVDTRKTTWRMHGDERYITDEGHALLDLELGQIRDVDALSEMLLNIAGVIETGLFVDIADTVVIGAASGEARWLYAKEDEKIVDLENTDEFDALVARIAETGGLL